MNLRDTILDLHSKGADVDEIAAYLHQSKYRVQQIITHGGYPWQENPRRAAILRLHGEGFTVQEISRKWRIGKATVQRVVDTQHLQCIPQPSPSVSDPWVNGDLPWLPFLSRNASLCARI